MINNKYMNRDLGVPIFAQNSKFFWESAGGAALISGIGGLFGSGSSAAAAKAQAKAARYAADMQYKATQETNQANIQIAQEANQNNYKMFQEQNQWNLDQWNRENEYNSASSQRQRLEDAGLNPYLMMSGGSAGTASSITSASPTPTVTPTMQTPDMSLYAQTGYSGVGAALSGLGSLFQSGVQGYMQGAQLVSQMDLQKSQKAKTDAETTFQNITNSVALADKLLDMKQKYHNIQGTSLDNMLKSIDLYVKDQLKSWTIMEGKGRATTAYAQGIQDSALSEYADEFAANEMQQRINALELQRQDIRLKKQQYKIGSQQYRLLWKQEQQLGWQIKNLQASYEKTVADTVGVKQNNEWYELTKETRNKLLQSQEVEQFIKTIPTDYQTIISLQLTRPDLFRNVHLTDDEEKALREYLAEFYSLNTIRKAFSGK